MAQNNDNDSASKLVWFFAGAAMGAAVALLYAPQEGERTRRMLKQKARRGRDVIADHANDLIDKGTDLYRKGRDVAEDAADMVDRGRGLVERHIRG
jgi:gas vesicle protein